MENKIKQLAEEHWKFVEGLLVACSRFDTEEELNAVKYLYIESFIHGWKHAVTQSEVEASRFG